MQQYTKKGKNQKSSVAVKHKKKISAQSQPVGNSQKFQKSKGPINKTKNISHWKDSKKQRARTKCTGYI